LTEGAKPLVQKDHPLIVDHLREYGRALSTLTQRSDLTVAAEGCVEILRDLEHAEADFGICNLSNDMEYAAILWR